MPRVPGVRRDVFERLVLSDQQPKDIHLTALED